MPPRAKKTTPASPNGGRAAKSNLDRLRAEVAAESPDAQAVLHPVAFAGTTVLIKDFWDWPVEANETLAQGLIVRWAAMVMPDADFKVWANVQPTNRQAAEFLAGVEEAIGFPLGSWLTSLNR